VYFPLAGTITVSDDCSSSVKVIPEGAGDASKRSLTHTGRSRESSRTIRNDDHAEEEE
jgi:hypothetical protein